MDQHPPPPPSPQPVPQPAPRSVGPPYPSRPAPIAPPAAVVHVTAKSGGFTRAIMFVLGLFLFAGVFVIGLGLGVVSMTFTAPIRAMLVEQEYRAGSGSETIAIVPVTGIIDGRQASVVRHSVDRILADDSVRAVILRVDSPGGGVTASDQIWYQVERLKKARMPVLASYGGLAASGGYYVSCGTDHIMAEETCTTGSIGVIAQVLTMEGLLDKVGVEPVTLVASQSPDKDVANDIFRAWNEKDREKIRVMLDAAYETFIDRVEKGRSQVITDPARLAALADGSIYTAAQALEAGLIDAVGYLDDAVAEAERRARLVAGRARVVMLREPPSLLGGLVPGFATRAPARELDADTIRSLVNDLGAPRMMYLMR